MTSQLIETFSRLLADGGRPRARSRRKYVHIRAFLEQATGPGNRLGISQRVRERPR